MAAPSPLPTTAVPGTSNGTTTTTTTTTTINPSTIGVAGKYANISKYLKKQNSTDHPTATASMTRSTPTTSATSANTIPGMTVSASTAIEGYSSLAAKYATRGAGISARSASTAMAAPSLPVPHRITTTNPSSIIPDPRNLPPLSSRSPAPISSASPSLHVKSPLPSSPRPFPSLLQHPHSHVEHHVDKLDQTQHQVKAPSPSRSTRPSTAHQPPIASRSPQMSAPHTTYPSHTAIPLSHGDGQPARPVARHLFEREISETSLTAEGDKPLSFQHNSLQLSTSAVTGEQEHAFPPTHASAMAQPRVSEPTKIPSPQQRSEYSSSPSLKVSQKVSPQLGAIASHQQAIVYSENQHLSEVQVTSSSFFDSIVAPSGGNVSAEPYSNQPSNNEPLSELDNLILGDGASHRASKSVSPNLAFGGPPTVSQGHWNDYPAFNPASRAIHERADGGGDFWDQLASQPEEQQLTHSDLYPQQQHEIEYPYQDSYPPYNDDQQHQPQGHYDAGYHASSEHNVQPAEIAWSHNESIHTQNPDSIIFDTFGQQQQSYPNQNQQYEQHYFQSHTNGESYLSNQQQSIYPNFDTATSQDYASLKSPFDPEDHIPLARLSQNHSRVASERHQPSLREPWGRASNSPLAIQSSVMPPTQDGGSKSGEDFFASLQPSTEATQHQEASQREYDSQQQPQYPVQSYDSYADSAADRQHDYQGYEHQTGYTDEYAQHAGGHQYAPQNHGDNYTQYQAPALEYDNSILAHEYSQQNQDANQAHQQQHDWNAHSQQYNQEEAHQQQHPVYQQQSYHPSPQHSQDYQQPQPFYDQSASGLGINSQAAYATPDAQRRKGHAIAIFSFGKLITTFPRTQSFFRGHASPARSSTYGTQQPEETRMPGKLRLVPVQMLLRSWGQHIQVVHPLLYEKSKKTTKKTEVLKMLDLITSKGNSGISVDMMAIYRLLLKMMEGDGVAFTDANLSSVMSFILPEGERDSPFMRLNQLPAHEQALIAGDREGAYRIALSTSSWPDVMIIGQSVHPTKYQEAVNLFLESGPENASSGSTTHSVITKMLYRLFTGTQGSSAIRLGPEDAPSWKHLVCAVLNNRLHSQDPHLFVVLGDELSRFGLQEAAHFCYLLTGHRGIMSGLDDPNGRMCLLGGFHTSMADRSSFLDSAALQSSLFYEYALSLNVATSPPVSPASLGAFQLLKVAYIFHLLELGYYDVAYEHYESVEYLAKSTNFFPQGSPYFHAGFVESMKELADLLSALSKSSASALNGRKSESSGWLSRLGSISGNAIGRGFESLLQSAVGEPLDPTLQRPVSPSKADTDAFSFARMRPDPQMAHSASQMWENGPGLAVTSMPVRSAANSGVFHPINQAPMLGGGSMLQAGNTLDIATSHASTTPGTTFNADYNTGFGPSFGMQLPPQQSWHQQQPQPSLSGYSNEPQQQAFPEYPNHQQPYLANQDKIYGVSPVLKPATPTMAANQPVPQQNSTASFDHGQQSQYHAGYAHPPSYLQQGPSAPYSGQQQVFQPTPPPPPSIPQFTEALSSSLGSETTIDTTSKSNGSLFSFLGASSTSNPTASLSASASSQAPPPQREARVSSSPSPASDSNKTEISKSTYTSIVSAFGTLFGGKRENHAHLPSGSSLFFDEKQGKWVRKDGAPLHETKELAPPPMSFSGGIQVPVNTPNQSAPGTRAPSRQDSPLLGGAAKKRGARNKYVDVFNPNAPAPTGVPAIPMMPGAIRPPSGQVGNVTTFIPKAAPETTSGTMGMDGRPPSPVALRSSGMMGGGALPAPPSMGQMGSLGAPRRASAGETGVASVRGGSASAITSPRMNPRVPSTASGKQGAMPAGL